MLSKIESLKNHKVKTENNRIFKKEILKNVRIVYNARLDIIEGFEKEIFDEVRNKTKTNRRHN